MDKNSSEAPAEPETKKQCKESTTSEVILMVLVDEEPDTARVIALFKDQVDGVEKEYKMGPGMWNKLCSTNLSGRSTVMEEDWEGMDQDIRKFMNVLTEKNVFTCVSEFEHARSMLHEPNETVVVKAIHTLMLYC
jgi:hypothetical protein